MFRSFVAFLALGASALGFLTWAHVCARLDISVAAAALHAVPPVAALVAWLLLGEVPSTTTIAGGALALAGVALAASSGGRTNALGRPADGHRGPADQ
jgi:drug/metabolite transporter (DMT)-like permease